MDVDRWFSKLNPVMSSILQSPLHLLLSFFLIDVTVTGRRSGRRSTIPVGYQRDGDTLVVMVSQAARKNWWRNFEEPRGVEVRLRGRRRRGMAEVVAPGSPEFRRRAEETVSRVPGMDRVFGIRYDRRAGLTDEQVRQLAEQIAVVRITLDVD